MANPGIESDLTKLALDHQSFVPYYQQIVEQVREMVKGGRIKEGETFWSEHDVSRHLGISKMPVRQAFQKLRSEGLLVVEKGKRPLVGSGRLPWNFQELRGFSEEMRRRGLVPAARLLSSESIPAKGELAQALRLTDGAMIYCIRRLRLVNGDPVAVVTSYLPARIFPNIDRQNLESHSLYAIFENIYKRRLNWAEDSIGAVSANQEEATILETAPGSPLLLILETTYDMERIPIEYSRSLLRGDRYTASVISVRNRSLLNAASSGRQGDFPIRGKQGSRSDAD
ncbi:MAG: GntR family transcriptional regulator [Terriglobales bacterium]|jgi:GntR family transcriptional regulator